jgi:hypothetical protein
MIGFACLAIVLALRYELVAGAVPASRYAKLNQPLAAILSDAQAARRFLGGESVCAFFTWPASSTENFLISYTSTKESARYAENHLSKMIRLSASTPETDPFGHSHFTTNPRVSFRRL